MVNFLNPMLNGFGVILSAVGLALSIIWENKIGNYELDINKRAFFTLHEIYAKQIPDYQGMALGLFLALFAYKLYDMCETNKKEAQSDDPEQKYLLAIAKKNLLEWGNIILTSSFLFLTIGLSCILGLVFAILAKEEVGNITNRFSQENYNNITEKDTKQIDKMNDDLDLNTGIQIMNIICLILLFAQIVIMIVQKKLVSASLKLN